MNARTDELEPRPLKREEEHNSYFESLVDFVVMPAYPLSRKLLILDLDSTLIFSSDQPSVPYNFTFVPPGGARFWVVLRPGLYEFLSDAAADYDLAVWTAGGYNYAAEIVSRIIPFDINLKFVYDNRKCVKKVSTWGPAEGVILFKPLKKVWKRKTSGYTKKNTLILDDTPMTYCKNYGNAIPIKSFVGDPADRELERVGKLLKMLRDVEDVRLVYKSLPFNWL